MASLRSVEDIIGEIEKRDKLEIELSEDLGELTEGDELIEDMRELYDKITEENEKNKEIIISKQSVLDTIMMYKSFRKDDSEFIRIALDVESLINTNRKRSEDTIQERDIFFKIQDDIDEYIKKLEEELSKVDQVAESNLKIVKNGRLVWATDEDFQKNQSLYGIEHELNKRRFDISEKRAIIDMFRIYLNQQSEGALEIDYDDETAVFVDGVGKKLYLVDKELPCKVYKENETIRDKLVKDEYPLFPGQPHANDITQRNSLDRYFLSALSILADVHGDKIRECMKDNLDGTVTVRFFARDEDIKYSPVYVTVDKVVESKVGAIINGPNGCIWASCFERALAISGLYDCTNQNRPFTRPVPKDIERQYDKLKFKKDRGELFGQALKDAKEEFPWLFSTETSDKPAELRRWPRVDCIIEGYAGPVAEMLLGERFKSCSIVMPKERLDETAQLASGNIAVPNYSEEELRFFEFIKKQLENGVRAMAGSKIDSKIIMEAHTYLLNDTYEDSYGRRYIKLRNPWGKKLGDENRFCGLMTSFDLSGRRIRKWTYVPDGIFKVELLEFAREMDFVDMNGINRHDMQIRSGKAVEDQMMDKFYDMAERLYEAQKNGLPQKILIKSIDGLINPAHFQKEILEFFVDDNDVPYVTYINEDGQILDREFKDIYLKNEGFLFRDEREEVLKGLLKPGEKEKPQTSYNYDTSKNTDIDNAYPDEALDLHTLSSYLKSVDDLNHILDSTRKYSDDESDIYRNLCAKIKMVKSSLIMLRDKPFTELRDMMDSITPYIDAYDRYCIRYPMDNWRRKLRTESCSMLRFIIDAADRFQKRPNRPIYEAFAEVYAIKLAEQKGLVLNEEGKKVVAKRLLDTPEHYANIKKKNIFYMKNGLNKEFMAELNRFK